MKRQYHVLARHSGNLLKAVHRLGLCTDLSLAAAVVVQRTSEVRP